MGVLSSGPDDAAVADSAVLVLALLSTLAFFHVDIGCEKDSGGRRPGEQAGSLC